MTIGNNGIIDVAPVIGDNAFFGANSCVFGNVTLGNGVVIGGGTIVVKSCSDNVVLVGNPARVIVRKAINK